MPREQRKVPWLDTRDNGTYYVFWSVSKNGRTRTERLSLRTRDADEAAGRYAAFLTQGRDIYTGKPVGLTCGAALDAYLDEHVEKGPVVDKQRQRDGIRSLKLFFEDKQVAEVGIPESRAYAAARMGGTLGLKTRGGKTRKASAGTVKRELNILLAAINHCVAWKKGITAADVPSFEKPKTQRSKGLWLFHDELQALRAAADQRTRDFIDLAYYTGARRRSIETLTWFQVDLERGRINLAKPNDPVTKKRKPIVPISPELTATLTRLKSEATSGFVLGSAASVWSGFKSARKKAGLKSLPARSMRPSGSCSPHILRHSRATHLLQTGAKPKLVADLLGDDVATVLRVYGHACPDWMADEMGVGEGA